MRLSGGKACQEESTSAKERLELQLIGQETVMMSALLVQSKGEISEHEHELDYMGAVRVWICTLS